MFIIALVVALSIFAACVITSDIFSDSGIAASILTYIKKVQS